MGGSTLNKKRLILSAATVLILSIIGYKNYSTGFKIDRNKIKDILYTYEVDNNKMATFNVSNRITTEDINSIVDSLNKGVLKPDKKGTGEYTKEWIEVLVLGDRVFNIYKQKDGRFTAMYSVNPGSNNVEDDKQTTIDSEVLESYFVKFRELSKGLEPSLMWDLNKK